MITYEKALELKDAGFPQPKGYNNKCCNGESDPEQCPYNPTLSELILECGESFEELRRKRDRVTGIITFLAYGMIPDESNPNVHGRGYSPDEAVADLYIAIHKK